MREITEKTLKIKYTTHKLGWLFSLSINVSINGIGFKVINNTIVCVHDMKHTYTPPL